MRLILDRRVSLKETDRLHGASWFRSALAAVRYNQRGPVTGGQDSGSATSGRSGFRRGLTFALERPAGIASRSATGQGHAAVAAG